MVTETKQVYPTKDCMYCGRPVTCNQVNCNLRGHVCPWNGSRKSYNKNSYDCRMWIAMIRSNIPCYKHFEYYTKHREWEMWNEWYIHKVII